jgi:rhodanese-related sulfurtransferase
MRPTRLLPRPIVLAAVGLAAAGVLVTGCSSSGDTATATTPAAAPSAPASQGPAAPGPSSPSSPQRVDVATFAQVIAEPGVTVVDVRTPAEFAAGHLDGAVNIDVESADFAARVGELDPAGTYAVYCRSGNRSAAAVAQMAQAGVTGTYDLDGGIVAWEAAGQPVVA